MIKVKATKLGFYGGQLRHPGDEFEIDKALLGSWMVQIKKTRKKKASSEDQEPED